MIEVMSNATARDAPRRPTQTHPLRVACRLLVVALGACLVLSACSEDDDDFPSGGIVSQLTGDPDGEVSPELQAMVAEAVARDPMDEPVDF